jgi:hypothetical protein
LISMFAPWAWVGLVTLYVRFGLSARRAAPSERWSCPNCRFLNYRYALICEACKQPWIQDQVEIKGTDPGISEGGPHSGVGDGSYDQRGSFGR